MVLGTSAALASATFVDLRVPGILWVLMRDVQHEALGWVLRDCRDPRSFGLDVIWIPHADAMLIFPAVHLYPVFIAEAYPNDDHSDT